MDMLLAALGMLACLAIMALVMPLAMRLGRRLRRPTAAHAQAARQPSRRNHPTPRHPGSRPRRTARVVEPTDVLVVGGGQAGLAASYYLSRAGVEHLVLDAERRVGDAWRRRWDSLELFSAAR